MQVKQVPDIPEQNNDNLPDTVAAPLAWKHHKLLHRSIIVELFQVCTNLSRDSSDMCFLIFLPFNLGFCVYHVIYF